MSYKYILKYSLSVTGYNITVKIFKGYCGHFLEVALRISRQQMSCFFSKTLQLL